MKSQDLHATHYRYSHSTTLWKEFTNEAVTSEAYIAFSRGLEQPHVEPSDECGDGHAKLRVRKPVSWHRQSNEGARSYSYTLGSNGDYL